MILFHYKQTKLYIEVLLHTFTYLKIFLKMTTGMWQFLRIKFSAPCVDYRINLSCCGLIIESSFIRRWTIIFSRLLCIFCSIFRWFMYRHKQCTITWPYVGRNAWIWFKVCCQAGQALMFLVISVCFKLMMTRFTRGCCSNCN